MCAGYEGVMLRKIADKISGLGYLVLVPDFFFGDCIYSTSPPEVRANWLNNHSPENGCENARKIIGELKSKGVCSLGAAGFCWGGMMVVKFAKYNDIKAAVILHPGRLPDNDVKGELDQLCPQEEVKRYGKILSENQEVESFVKIFKGVCHGWASRYSEDDESAVRSAEEAHTDMLNWLTKYVT
ncbi:putative dienelactone hydrolase, alpha/Beta hydrolase [Helianthus annuus]|nr:putative dienelactone hydrolase, alpha/Beta hydrolase [Helianthus annuus]